MPAPKPGPGDETIGEASTVPGAVRIVAWFWLATAALGLGGGVVELLEAVREGGDLTFTLPVGVGVSGWAIGRGLLRGDRRAWKWARRLAAIAPLVLVIVAVLMMLFPGNAQLTFPGGARSVRPWDPLVLLPATVLVLFFCWQFIVLGKPETRQAYASAGAG